MRTRAMITRTLSLVVIFSSLLAGIVSCNKEKNEIRDTPPPGAGMLAEYKHGDEFIRFDYNVDGTVKKATVKSELNTNGGIVDYNISYTAAKKISSIQTSAGERIVPVYENGVLIRADAFEGNERTGYTNYHFENNLLTRTTMYWNDGNDYLPFFELIFTHDNAGNNTGTVAMIATGEPGQLERFGHVVYQHDNKVNPLYAHKELLALLWRAASKNNITQEDHFDSMQALEDRHIYTYTYKTDGLPDHAEVKSGLPGQVPVTNQVDFIYR